MTPLIVTTSFSDIFVTFCFFLIINDLLLSKIWNSFFLCQDEYTLITNHVRHSLNRGWSQIKYVIFQPNINIFAISSCFHLAVSRPLGQPLFGVVMLMRVYAFSCQKILKRKFLTFCLQLSLTKKLNAFSGPKITRNLNFNYIAASGTTQIKY